MDKEVEGKWGAGEGGSGIVVVAFDGGRGRRRGRMGGHVV